VSFELLSLKIMQGLTLQIEWYFELCSMKVTNWWGFTAFN